jgi:hypothetical protein
MRILRMKNCGMRYAKSIMIIICNFLIGVASNRNIGKTLHATDNLAAVLQQSQTTTTFSPRVFLVSRNMKRK